MTVRKRRAPAEKAQEALDIATRRVEKVKTRRSDLEQQVEALRVEQNTAEAEVAYFALNPHLPKNAAPAAEAPAAKGAPVVAKEPPAVTRVENPRREPAAKKAS